MKGQDFRQERDKERGRERIEERRGGEAISNMNIFPSFTAKGPVALQPLESRPTGVRGMHCHVVGVCCPIFQFLLRQAFADDEASTRLLQILLCLLVSTASLMFIPCAVRSSFTLSIHFFGRLPLLLVPSTCPYSATAGSLHLKYNALIKDIY